MADREDRFSRLLSEREKDGKALVCCPNCPVMYYRDPSDTECPVCGDKRAPVVQTVKNP